ncbi:MAG: BTAD domain-containing putative transcriptional regulator [Sporichthyaceae bacterium]
MTLSLLGPLQVDGDGQLSPRDRVVLSALAIRSGDVLTAEQLADALWGEYPPPSWPKVVQGCVARLRLSIGRQAIETTSGGYRLALADDEIDVRQFEVLIERARQQTATGEHDRAAALLAQALDLWRGAALPDLDRWPDGRTEATRLDELRLGAQEALLTERAAGRRDVVADATALVAAQPLRETRWWLLALALYRAGRQSDALSALRRARRTLQDELGLDPGQQLVELELAILNHDAGLAAPALPTSTDRGVCPYQGLVVYDRGDSERFFGRDEETAACVRVLRDSSLLVVAGPSGSGKSSLVRAGVVPRLERTGRHVVVITPGTDPRGALAGAVAAPGRDLVVVVDQLEELFTGRQEPDLVREFLDNVAGLVRSGRGVVLVVRADHVGGFSRSPAVARLVERGLHLVTSMTDSDLRAAIVGPAQQVGLRLEPGLVELLVRDVEGEPGALPLLSHALAETWERREAGVLTVEGYQATGGIREAVAQSAERMWESLAPPQRATARALMLRLVTVMPDGEPAAARLPLSSVAGDPGREQLLDLLARCRLVTTDEASVTVAHEAVIRAWPRLRSWLDEDSAGLLTVRHLSVAADDWDGRGRPDSELYRGSRLSSVQEWRRRTSPSLSGAEEAFLDASLALATAEHADARARTALLARQHRRLRGALAGTAVALVLALVAGLVAVEQGQRTARAARTALVERLVAQSAALRSTHRDLAALLAVEAYRIRPSAATRGALLGVFTAAPGFLGFTATDTAGRAVPLSAGRLLPGGSTLLAVGVDGVARLLDLGSGRVRGRFPAPALPPIDSRMDLSRNGRTLAVVSWEGPERGGGRATLSVYDTQSRSLLTDARLPFDVGAVAVSPDGHYVAVSGYDDGHVLVFDIAGHPQLPELLTVSSRARGVQLLPTVGSAPGFTKNRHTAALAFLPDGSLLAGSEVGIVRVVDPATGQVVRRLTGAPPLTSNNTFTLSGDGSVVVSTGSAGVARWDLTHGGTAWAVDVPESRCGTAVLLDRQVLCGGRVGQVEALDAATGLPATSRYDMQRGVVSALVVTPDAKTLVELSASQPVLATWRLDGSGLITRLLPPTGAPTGYDASGRLLLMSGPDTVVDRFGVRRPVWRVVDARSGALVRRDDHDLEPLWTDQPARLAAWNDTGRGVVRDVRDNRTTARLDGGFGDPPLGQSVSADGSRLLAWGSYGSGRIDVWEVWDLRTGEGVAAQFANGGNGGALTRSGRLLVWSDDDGLSTYRTSDGRLLARRPGLSVGTVSPTGVVVASGADGALHFLDSRNLRNVGPPLSGGAGAAVQLAFSRDGGLLAALGEGGRVRLVDVASRTQLGEPIELGGDRSIAVRPDGLALAQPGAKGLLLWDLRPTRWRTAACRYAGRALTREEWQRFLRAVGDYRPACPAR